MKQSIQLTSELLSVILSLLKNISNTVHTFLEGPTWDLLPPGKGGKSVTLTTPIHPSPGGEPGQ